MDNQQAKVSDISWLAGFIDGEGCFDFVPCHTNSRNKPFLFHYPRLRIANTHAKTLEYVVEILDSIPVGHWVNWRTPHNPNYRKSWAVTIQGMKRLDTFLPLIEPYLFTKKAECIRLEQWIQLRKQHIVNNQYVKTTPYSDVELRLMREVKSLKTN